MWLGFVYCTVFRDNILKALTAAKPGDFEEIAQQLDRAGNDLEYHKYGETLFEILLTGGLLGMYIQLYFSSRPLGNRRIILLHESPATWGGTNKRD